MAVAAVVAACNRTPTSGPAEPEDSAPATDRAVVPSAAPVAPSAALAASAAQPLPARMTLSVRRERADGPAVVFLVAPELGFEARIRELRSPYVCQLAGAGNEGAVTCTPLAHQVVAKVRASPQGIEVTPLLGKPVVTPISAGRSWVVRASEASERDLPGSACAADAPSRDVRLEFRMHHDMDKGSFFHLMLPSSRPGGAQGVELFRHPAQISCRSEGTEEARHVACSGAKLECDFRVEGASVAFECKGATAASGRFLLPCGARARLSTAGLIGMTYSYH